MALLLHLSDLHLFSNPHAPEEQQAIFDALILALEHHLSTRGKQVDLLVVTGDVFDSVTLDPPLAASAFIALCDRIRKVAGPRLATVVVPGNHDRRRLGFFAPHRGDLFSHLGTTMSGKSFVHGRRTPFLAEVVPHALHGLPLWIIAYDSTYLPAGLMSAGGVIRQEDVLHAASAITGKEPDWPVLFLLHHHLVPTPLTDLGTAAMRTSGRIVRFGIERVLPGLVSNADREELMMTALGAGTALSTLHTLGRAVIVLHGHKHYPTARLLKGTQQDEGDVLLVSAGSAGTAEPWSPTVARDAARLWPSFNVVEIDERGVDVRTVSFGYKGSSAGKGAPRELVCAAREGSQWAIRQAPAEPPEDVQRRVELNESVCRLTRSAGVARFDYACERRVLRDSGTSLARYVETVEGAPGAVLRVQDGPVAGMRTRELPAHFSLKLGGVTRYVLERGVCRTVGEVERAYGVRTSPFEWMDLMNRYWSSMARLVVEGLGARAHDAFASATDLATGSERAWPFVVKDGRVVLERERCPPRTLLRVYWPVELEDRRPPGGWQRLS